MIRQCAILFGCLALGELIVWLTGVKLPSSIIGMLLLTLFLKLGWIKLHWVQGMSDFLVAIWLPTWDSSSCRPAWHSCSTSTSYGRSCGPY